MGSFHGYIAIDGPDILLRWKWEADGLRFRPSGVEPNCQRAPRVPEGLTGVSGASPRGRSRGLADRRSGSQRILKYKFWPVVSLAPVVDIGVLEKMFISTRSPDVNVAPTEAKQLVRSSE